MACGQTLFKLSALAVLAGIGSPAFAFDSLAVFGDSLSDTGNNGHWIWNSNQNKLYDEHLAEHFGLHLSPSRTGGNNYSAGNATAEPTLNPADNTQDQVKEYLRRNGGRADSKGLYIHWIGGNDLAAAASQPTKAQAIVANSAASAGAQIGMLLDAGAGLVVAPNAPDISATPFVMESVLTAGLGAAATSAIKAAYASLNAAQTPDLASRQQAIHRALLAAASSLSNDPQTQQAIAAKLIAAYDATVKQISSLTDYYNAVQSHTLAQHGGNIAVADINGLFHELQADPYAFGLTNTAGMACPPGVPASECSTSTPGFNHAGDYLFSDHFHPGPIVHAIIAQYIESIISAPVQVTHLNQGIQSMVRGTRSTLDSRYQQLRQIDNPVGTVGVFGGYSGGYQHVSSRSESGGGHENNNNLSVGVDYQLTDNLLVGGLIAGSLDKQRPDSNYRYNTSGFQAMLFSQLRVGQAWLDGDFHYLTADFSDIQRTITLGKQVRTEKGDTNGALLGGRLTAGYDFAVTQWLTTGPMLQYALDYSQVDGYSEKGTGITAMRFGDQTAHSQVGSVGWRVDAHVGSVTPWAQVNYRHQFGDDRYSANGGLKSTPLTFSREGETQDTNWVDFAVGASLPISDSVSTFAAVSQTGGLSNGNQTNYNVGISAKF
nr:autotransporter domain-containing protein [Pantoea sp. 201603H]